MMQSMKSYYVAIFASLAISIGIQMVLPFPYGMITAIGIFMAWPIIIRYGMMSKYVSNKYSFMPKFKFEKHCISCGMKSSRDECSRCGSKSFNYK